jgi:hypothetical protein
MRPEGNIIPLKYANTLLPALVLSGAIPFLLTTKIPQLILPAIGKDNSQLLVVLLPIFPSVPWLLTTILGKFSFTGRNSKTIIFGLDALTRCEILRAGRGALEVDMGACMSFRSRSVGKRLTH